MNKYLIILSVLFTSIHLNSQTTFLLQEGTIIQVMLSENLDSRVSKVGDQVRLAVCYDVMVDSMIVIEKEAPVTGKVVRIKEANFAGVQGQLEFSIDYVVGVDGQNIRLRSVQYLDGKSRTEEVVVAAVLLHPLFLVFKGKDVSLEEGTVFTAYVDRNYEFVF